MDTNQALTIINQDGQARYLEALRQAANKAASSAVLEDYQARKSAETLRRQRADIAAFERYLNAALEAAGVSVSGMADDLCAWSFIDYGLVEGFNRWQLSEGYAIGSINVHLATIKTYCELAAKNGSLPAQALSLIKTVKGFKRAEGRNQDEKRARTRRGEKKAEPTMLAPTLAALLKQQPDTPKGRRDALIMCLALDHGLRVGEIAALDMESINLLSGELTFYRHKVDAWQTHTLTPDTWRAASAYLEQEGRESGPLFTSVLRGEKKAAKSERISTRTINARIGTLGARLAKVENLSPHDMRHFWATLAVRNGTDIKSLQDAGGWSSPAMPLRYAASARIANAGVKLAK